MWGIVKYKYQIKESKSKTYTLFPWAAQSVVNPTEIKSARGVYITDTTGKTYLDFASQLVSVNCGHNHPKINKAIHKQLDQLCYVSPAFATKARGELGEVLANITPKSLTKTLFTCDGTATVEHAIKLARRFSGKHKIITRYRSYHGSTYGSMSAGGDSRRFYVDREVIPGIVHVEDPYVYRCPWGQETAEECGEMWLKHVERVIQFEGPDSIAAFMMEGESGISSCCIKYPPNIWKGIKKLAKKYGFLIIADEVMSGFGRTGEWFGINHSGVEPDMMCMSKGITNSMVPLGALSVSKEMAEFFETTPLPVGLTFCSHTLACRAALASIKVYKEEKLIDKAKYMGEYVLKKATHLKDQFDIVGDVRLTGLLGCLELVTDKKSKMHLMDWSGPPNKYTKMLMTGFKEAGLFTLVRWNIIGIAPPLVINKAEVDEGFEKLERVLAKVQNYVSKMNKKQFKVNFSKQLKISNKKERG